MFAEDNTFTDSSISQEEREEILDEINDIVSSNKIKYDSGNYKVKAKHKGILFPITWVIISAVIIAGGILGAGLFFGARQRDQIANSRSQFEDSTSTAQAILQRAQAELEEAEAALNDINSELSNVAAELESERQAFDSRLEEEQTRLQRGTCRGACRRKGKAGIGECLRRGNPAAATGFGRSKKCGESKAVCRFPGSPTREIRQHSSRSWSPPDRT
jgi:hypothetical protein